MNLKNKNALVHRDTEVDRYTSFRHRAEGRVECPRAPFLVHLLAVGAVGNERAVRVIRVPAIQRSLSYSGRQQRHARMRTNPAPRPPARLCKQLERMRACFVDVS